MKTTTGELRNITSGILHTKIEDVYSFFEKYLQAEGIMTHHLPSAREAILPILKQKLSDAPEWFTEEWIKDGLDEVVYVPDLTEDEKNTFWQDFNKLNGEMWESIKDKAIIVKT